MNRLRNLRLIPAVVVLSYLLTTCPGSLLMAAEPAAAPPEQVPIGDDVLASARELIKTGEYDRAIEVLKSAIAGGRGDPARLRDGYLLLIKTYVFLGNDLKFKPQGREVSNLNYRAARELIAECLRVKDLRHTRPEPASEYPPEMVSAFTEVRGQIFGSFRVVGLEPRDALISLDGDTLRALQPGSLLGDVDVAVGPHRVVVRAPGFMLVTEEVSISPNSTIERSYQLKRRRSRVWYATVGTGTVGVVGGLIALLARGAGGAAAVEPLPGAPPPPSR